MSITDIKTIAVAGAGTMGALIAQTFASHGYAVVLWNRSEAGLARGRSIMAENLNAIPPAERDAVLSGITMTTDPACFRVADFVLESIAEDLEVKKAFYRQLEPLLKETCLVSTNTSGLSITALAEAFASPERFCGMHWINPANLIPLIEVISGEATAPETAQTVYALSEALEKKPIRVKDVPGFALNRLQFAVLREALHMVETGAASMEDVDKAMKYGLGLRYACIGPFETADLGGLDIFCGISEYLFADLADDKEPQELLRQKKAGGKLGLKSGEGFFDYSGDRGAKAVEERNRKLTALSKILFGT